MRSSPRGSRVPVVAGGLVRSDDRAVHERLVAEEHARRDELARLEAALRRFEDVDRPAYRRWVRLALGPLVQEVELAREALRLQQLRAQRLTVLVEQDGLAPREALYLVEHPEAAPPPRRDRVDPDEVAARRRAKLERKRAERRAAQRAARQEQGRAAATADAPSRAVRITRLYRAVARHLHPDSATATRSLDPGRVRVLWEETQVAYRTGNLERLWAIAAWLDAGAPAAGAGDAIPMSLGERSERVRMLGDACRLLARQLAQLADDPAWAFSERAPSARHGLRNAAERTLTAERAGIDAALADLRVFFASIGTSQRPRGGRRR